MKKILTEVTTLSQAVLRHPNMYTLHGTFDEALAFLEGYYSGMAKGIPYAVPVIQWAEFKQWLAAQLSVDLSDMFAKFAELYEDSPTALARLNELLDQFLQSKTKTE